MKRIALLIAATLVAAPVHADDKGIIWMDSTDGVAAKAPKDKEIIWADSTGGLGAKEPRKNDVIWVDTTGGTFATNSEEKK